MVQYDHCKFNGSDGSTWNANDGYAFDFKSDCVSIYHGNESLPDVSVYSLGFSGIVRIMLCGGNDFFLHISGTDRSLYCDNQYTCVCSIFLLEHVRR